MTQPPACKCVIWTWNHICVDVLRRTTSEKKAITARLNLAHLGLHLPTGNGCFAIIAGFELQGDRAWADVGNGHVGRRTGKFYEGGEERAKLGQRKKERLREHITNTNVGLFCLAAFFGLWTFHLPHRPLVAAQILHMDDFFFFTPSGISLISLLHPTSAKSRLDLENRRDAYTQYTGGDNAMNVNYPALIWRYHSIWYPTVYTWAEETIRMDYSLGILAGKTNMKMVNLCVYGRYVWECACAWNN